MKKFIYFTLVILSLSIFLVACGNQAEENQGSSQNKEEEKVSENNSESQIEIDFWHSMSGNNGEEIQKIVDRFNEQSEGIHVNAIFQGSYEDSLTKLRALGGTEEAPAIVQVFEGGTKYMRESGFITPMQTFIDQDGFDVSILEENILSYYTLDDQLYSMPFNTSNAVMFYNKDLFKEAGLDPDHPPRTFSEVKEAAEKITKGKDQVGFSFATISWFFEQLMANSGGLIINNDNGRSGEATASEINSDIGLAIFEWIKEMNDQGIFVNYGSSWDDPRGPFFAGKLGMYFDSTANTAQVIASSSHEVGTAPMPVMDGVEPKGAVVGGASLWITNQVSEEEQAAAWEFIKFTTKADVQAEWAAGTGYFPITPAAYEEQVLKDIYEEYPQYTTAVKQLENTVNTASTAGALFSIMPEARKIIEMGLGEVYEGRDPQEALDDAAKKITEALQK